MKSPKTSVSLNFDFRMSTGVRGRDGPETKGTAEWEVGGNVCTAQGEVEARTNVDEKGEE